MPYIKQEDRARLEDDVPQTAGELNYCFTNLAIEYLNEGGTNYQRFNDVLGALEGCKLELYRRMIAPYEDIKIKENGDVY